ncbi:MAG: hypothetical protein ACOH18_00970 [Candidatus Saccharimonadaceae bacterium]
MTEQVFPTSSPDNNYPIDDTAEDYLLRLGSARTTRHASEVNYDSPKPEVAQAAVRTMRVDITRAMSATAIDLRSSDTKSSLEQMKEAYWQAASRVGEEHGATDGYDLSDYFDIKPGRSYREIKAEISGEYAEDTITRSVLAAIDYYTTALAINPAHSATIVMELLGRNLATIKNDAMLIMNRTKCSTEEACSQAVNTFMVDGVAKHVNYISNRFGRGDHVIRPSMNKASFYENYDNLRGSAALVLTQEDAAGLVRVYDIQSRPYSEDELSYGNEIGHQAAMQMAMLKIHNGLIETCRGYLAMHPERMQSGLENFSEIFVPDYSEGELTLLPNPKLIRAMMNNFMPAIATSLIDRQSAELTVEAGDIKEGIRIATGEFKLFQSRIGEFSKDDSSGETVLLESTFKSVCPAGSMFPNYVAKNLPNFYQASKA